MGHTLQLKNKNKYIFEKMKNAKSIYDSVWGIHANFICNTLCSEYRTFIVTSLLQNITILKTLSNNFKALQKKGLKRKLCN
jgi:hypothetical protein